MADPERPAPPAPNPPALDTRALDTSALDTHALDRVFRLIAARRGADPASSYTASLLAAAPERPARKVVEEAAECAMEAVRGDAAALRRESADLVFHLLVLLAGAGIEPGAVYAALAARPPAGARPGRPPVAAGDGRAA